MVILINVLKSLTNINVYSGKLVSLTPKTMNRFKGKIMIYSMWMISFQLLFIYLVYSKNCLY